MRVEDALRKIRLLRRITPENGASGSETENAVRIVRALMERYAIGKEDVQPVSYRRSRMTWIYWEALLDEFGIVLDRFAGHGRASLGGGAFIVIRLATGRWHVQQASPEGRKITVRDSGLDSLRQYLTRHAPRSFSLSGHGRPRTSGGSRG